MTRLLLTLCTAAAVSCFSAANERETLLGSVRLYNDAVRWNQIDAAANHVDAAGRQRFIDRRSMLDGELEVSDYEIQRIDLDGKHEHAEVQVDVAWSLARRGILQKTLVAQSWERKGGAWMVVKETRLRGAPLTVYEEPALVQDRAALDQAPPTRSR
ncbi:MAG: hypothetical protein EXR72_02390 [Myxococcales bacterium]|nr:hypothetical protein [Myxococcales bacterium]